MERLLPKGAVVRSRTRRSGKTSRPPREVKLPEQLDLLLKKHQKEALHMLWKAAVRSDGRDEDECDDARGAILAHSMGLGKTLTTICFIACFLCYRVGRDVLIVAPKIAVSHWASEFEKWRPTLATYKKLNVSVIRQKKEIPGLKAVEVDSDDEATEEQLKRAGERRHRIVVIGYEVYLGALQRHKQYEDAKNMCTTRSAAKQQQQQQPDKSWKAPDILRRPDLIVCDEAHRMKNSGTLFMSHVSRYCAAPRRISLSGTPLQNHVEEYYTMVQFVTPGLLGTKKVFTDNYAKPIAAGRKHDATPSQRETMRLRIAMLQERLRGVVHRCSAEELEKALPPKTDVVVFVRLKRQQHQLYKLLCDDARRRASGEATGAPDSLTMLLSFRPVASRVATNPLLLRRGSTTTEAAAAEPKQSGEEGDGSGASDNEDDSQEEEEKLRDLTGVERQKGKKRRSPPSWDVNAAQTFDAAEMEALGPEAGSKTAMALEIAKQAKAAGEKTVIFSFFVATLELMKRFIEAEGMTCALLTGQASQEQRSAMIKEFNSPDSTTDVFLGSAKASGVAISLVAANHCVLMDSSWNPADDSQVAHRVYRYGQQRPVFIYRLVAANTFEHQVFRQALAKEWLQRTVVDEAAPQRQSLVDVVEYFSYHCISDDHYFADVPDELREAAWAKLGTGSAIRSVDTLPSDVLEVESMASLLKEDMTEVLSKVEREMIKRTAAVTEEAGHGKVGERAPREVGVIRQHPGGSGRTHSAAAVDGPREQLLATKDPQFEACVEQLRAAVSAYHCFPANTNPVRSALANLLKCRSMWDTAQRLYARGVAHFVRSMEDSKLRPLLSDLRGKRSANNFELELLSGPTAALADVPSHVLVHLAGELNHCRQFVPQMVCDGMSHYLPFLLPADVETMRDALLHADIPTGQAAQPTAGVEGQRKQKRTLLDDEDHEWEKSPVDNRVDPSAAVSPVGDAGASYRAQRVRGTGSAAEVVTSFFDSVWPRYAGMPRYVSAMLLFNKGHKMTPEDVIRLLQLQKGHQLSCPGCSGALSNAAIGCVGVQGCGWRTEQALNNHPLLRHSVVMNQVRENIATEVSPALLQVVSAVLRRPQMTTAQLENYLLDEGVEHVMWLLALHRELAMRVVMAAGCDSLIDFANKCKQNSTQLWTLFRPVLKRTLQMAIGCKLPIPEAFYAVGFDALLRYRDPHRQIMRTILAEERARGEATSGGATIDFSSTASTAQDAARHDSAIVHTFIERIVRKERVLFSVN